MTIAAAWRDGVDMGVNAPPWDYNPSAWRQRIPIALLATVGFLIASYLALYQMDLVSNIWDPFFGNGSERVLDSEVAKSMDKWLHVPDGAFGAWGYLSEVIFSLVGGTRRWQHRPWMVILFGIDVIPLGGVSAILVIMQGFVVGSWCTLCLVSAAVSLLLVYFAYDEVWSCIKFLWRVWRGTHNWKLLWHTFWGGASEEAERFALER